MSEDIDIEKVLFLFALKEDSELEGLLARYLLPAIEKLSTPVQNVQTKVLELLTHINKRVKPATNIKLPLAGLVARFLDKAAAPVEKNFHLMYLELAIQRATPEEQHKACLSLLSGVAALQPQQQDTIMQIFLAVRWSLERYRPVSSQDRDARLAEFAFLKDDKTRAFFLDFMFDLILWFPNQTAGLSETQYKRIHGKAGWKPDDISDRKAHLLENLFLVPANDFFSDKEALPIYLVASVDSNSKVSRKGEDGLRRITTTGLEEKSVIDKLFQLVLGTQGNVAAADKRSQALPALRAKSMEYLSRSTAAANAFPLTLQTVFECFFGPSTTPKLKQQGLSFLQMVMRNAGDIQLKMMGAVLLTGVMKLLAVIKQDDSSASTLKSSTYQAIGALSKRMPQLFTHNVDILKDFFGSLSTEEVSVRVSIQEALAQLCPAYIAAAPEKTEQIIALLLQMTEKSDTQSRYLAMFYANRLFPFNHVSARYINLLGAADMQRQVSDEGARGLQPYVLKDNDLIPNSAEPFPDLFNLLTYIKKVGDENKANSRDGSSFSQPLFKEVLAFVRALIHRKIEDLEKDKEKMRGYISSFGGFDQDSNPFKIYRELLEEALTAKSTFDLLHVASQAFLELFGLEPSTFSAYYSDKLAIFIPLIGRGRPETRRIIARIVGLLAPSLDPSARSALILELMEQANVKTTLKQNEQIGAALALGCILSRCSELSVEIEKKSWTDAIHQIQQQLSVTTLQESAAEAIGLLGRHAPLPVEGKAQAAIISDIVKLLSSSDFGVVEAAAVALGNLALGNRQLSTDKDLLEGFYSTVKIKQEEVHFTIGEALSCVCGGWASDSAVDQLLATFAGKTRSDEPEPEPNAMAIVLTKLLEGYLLSDRADTRMASSIWLLCLLKNAGKHVAIQKELSRIQYAFSQLLGDQNEIVQEAASKGIVLVYELGDSKIQENLVDSLVSTLSAGKTGFKVSEDTKIFSEGQIGQTPSGGQLTTYKELLSLASEMNQPDLVYKFMNLATHHALWNSRKGAAFAAKTLAARAEDKLKPHLPLLIPKLFRASYDPNPKISSAMTNILTSLADPNKVSNEFFSEITKDLLDNMWNKQWRTREAACNAMADILVNKSFAQVAPFLEELWNRCFKVLDDVKETVRKSAEMLCRSLSSLTLRLCDPANTSVDDGKKALDIALPFLLQKGLIAEVKEVRFLSVSLIQKISKVAGFLLKSHIPALVDTMLESLTAMEPADLNYLSLKADQVGLKQDQIDAARMEISKLLPVNETLEFCLKQVDKSNLEELVPKIAAHLTGGGGVATKVGAAQFVTQLALRKKEEAAAGAPKLMVALRRGVINRSLPVRKAFAAALGQLARHASPKGISNTITELVDKYKKAEPEDDATRSAVAEALLELARAASQNIQPHYKVLVPVVFLARYDPSADTQKVFNAIWEECGASISLYLADVADQLVEALDASQWAMKKQAATAIAKISDLVNDYQMKPYAGRLFKALIAGLRGRLWSGKESFFEAVSGLVECCRNLFFASEAEKPIDLLTSTDLINAILAECKKKNMEYKKQAVICLASVLQSLDAAAIIQGAPFAVYDSIRADVIEISTKRSTSDDEESVSAKPTEALAPSSPNETALSLSVRMNAIKALGQGFPRGAHAQRIALEEVIGLMRKELDETSQFTMKALKVVTTRLDFKEGVSESMFDAMVAILLGAMADPSYSSVRTVAADAMVEFSSRTNETKMLQARAADIRTTLKEIGNKFQSSVGATIERILEAIGDDYPSKRVKGNN